MRQGFTTEASELLDTIQETVALPEDLKKRLDALLHEGGVYSSEYVFDEDRNKALLTRGSSCRCGVEADYGPCLLHPQQDHYFRPLDPQNHEEHRACAVEGCTYTEKQHRHMQEGEYDKEFPVVYDKHFKSGDRWYRVDARRYWDGVGVTFTEVSEEPGTPEYEKNGGGMCFDFDADAVGPLIQHLKQLHELL